MFKITFDSKSLDKLTTTVQKQVAYATMVALNRTASTVRNELKNEMMNIFDRPNPFTLNSLKVKPATRSVLEAVVWFKTPMDVGEFKREGAYEHYLKPQVYGGKRPFKNFEAGLHKAGVLPGGWYAVPGPAARLDAYGNQSRGQIVQILSAFKAFGEVGYLANRSYRKGARVTKTNRTAYVIVRPGQRKSPGVYVRTDKNFRQVLRFVNQVGYRKRFDFFGVSQRVVQREISTQFAKAIKEAMATAR
jgi:hypothetical protein